MRFLRVLSTSLLMLISLICLAEQSINPELQALKQQSLLLDRDLLVLEEKIKQPFNIYLSLRTDAKFVLETITIKLDGEELHVHKYNKKERLALKKGGAQLLFSGLLSPGSHTLIAYYRSNKDYQAGSEFNFDKSNGSQSIEISLRKGESKESRLQPKVLIEEVSPLKQVN